MLVVPSRNWVLITGLVFCCLFQWGFLYNLGANKFEPSLELSSLEPGVRGWILISREQGCPHCSARGRVGGGGVPQPRPQGFSLKKWVWAPPIFWGKSPGDEVGSAWVNARESMTAYIPFFPVPLSRDHDHLFADLVTTLERELEHFPLTAASRLSRVRWFSRVLAFRSLYYPWGKIRTTRNLGVHYLWYQSS